jgi:hypothetical protein
MSTVSRFLIKFASLIVCTLAAPITTSSSSRLPRQWQDLGPFNYSGPLTESVLIGCLATRFPGTTFEWDAANLTFTNHTEANRFIRRQYRRRWEMEGL